MENTTVTEGKTMAIISYIWWIGLIIAFIMNNDKKNSFASFHIRQSLGLGLISLLNYVVILRFLGGNLFTIINILHLILVIIGIIGAAKGEEKKIPLFGDMFQDWFKGIG